MFETAVFSGYLACSNATCIEASLFCNDEDDCGDGSDENCDYDKLLCNTSEFAVSIMLKACRIKF